MIRNVICIAEVHFKKQCLDVSQTKTVYNLFGSDGTNMWIGNFDVNTEIGKKGAISSTSHGAYHVGRQP